MAQTFRDRLTYANVMSTIAMFGVLGGGAYAAGIGKDDVTSKAIKAGAVKSADLGKNSVDSSKVKDGSLLDDDFGAGQLPVGERGPQGVQGVQGESGLAGTASAYADVDPDSCGAPPSTCTAPLRAKGVTAITHPSGGIFCVVAPGIDGRQVSAAVTVDWQHTTAPEGNASAMWNSAAIPAPDCANNTDFVVITQRHPSVAVRNTTDDGSVNVVGAAVLANNVGFTIVIP